MVRLLDVSDQTVSKWIRQADLPALTVRGQYRVNKVELQEWAQARNLRVSPELFAPGGQVEQLGACVFCGACQSACSSGAIEFTRDHRLASRRRDDLVIESAQEYRYMAALDAEMLRVFGRSLKLRQVSAGGCNGCESDLNVLSSVGFDLDRFGIQFEASPRHADGIVITGPVDLFIPGCPPHPFTTLDGLLQLLGRLPNVA